MQTRYSIYTVVIALVAFSVCPNAGRQTLGEETAELFISDVGKSRAPASSQENEIIVSDDGTTELPPKASIVLPSLGPSPEPESDGLYDTDDYSTDTLWTDNRTDGCGEPEIAAFGCNSAGCNAGRCSGDCGYASCGICPCTHASSVFAESLYLRPRDAEVSYAEPIDGPIAAPPANNPIQIGRIALVDPDYDTGFRAGFTIAMDNHGSVRGTFSQFQSHTVDSISVIPDDVIRSLVSHPSSTSAATDFLSASADYDIDFKTVDVDFRHIWRCGCNYEINCVIGARYANLEQEFDALFVNNGSELVSTNVDFDGGGIRFGLDGLRYSSQGNWHVYGRGAASFVAGEFRSRYFQGQSFDPTVVTANWRSGRVVSILDAEAGFAWLSNGGHLRASLGYVVSAWFNTVKTDEFIRAVQSSNFIDLGDTFSFDGLTTRIEFRF